MNSPPVRARRAPRLTESFATIALVLLALGVTFVVLQRIDRRESDATIDWMLVHTAAAGGDLSGDVAQMAEETGIDASGPLAASFEGLRAYRTPGGLLFFSPLLLVEWEAAHFLIVGIGLVAFLWLLLVLVPKASAFRRSEQLVPLGAAIVSMPYAASVHWGTVSAIVAVLSGFLWVGIDRLAETERGPAIALGTATALKLYPGLGLVVLFKRQKRSELLWGIGAFLVLNAVGAVIFGVSVTESARLIFEGASGYVADPANLSIAGLGSRLGGPGWVAFVSPVIAIVAVALAAAKWPIRKTLALAFTASVFAAPLVWIHYSLLVLPVVFWLLTANSWRVGVWAARIWLGIASLSLIISGLVGSVGVIPQLIVLPVILLVAVLASPDQLWLPRPTLRTIELGSEATFKVVA